MHQCNPRQKWHPLSGNLLSQRLQRGVLCPGAHASSSILSSAKHHSQKRPVKRPQSTQGPHATTSNLCSPMGGLACGSGVRCCAWATRSIMARLNQSDKPVPPSPTPLRFSPPHLPPSPVPLRVPSSYLPRRFLHDDRLMIRKTRPPSTTPLPFAPSAYPSLPCAPPSPHIRPSLPFRPVCILLHLCFSLCNGSIYSIQYERGVGAGGRKHLARGRAHLAQGRAHLD